MLNKPAIAGLWNRVECQPSVDQPRVSQDWQLTSRRAQSATIAGYTAADTVEPNPAPVGTDVVATAINHLPSVVRIGY